MTTKADFNAEEWSTIVEAPLLAGLRVIAADRGGTIRESLAMGRVYTEARESQGDSELVDQLVQSPPAVDQKQLQSAGDLGAASDARLREAIGVLESKAEVADVEAYKRFVLAVADAAARAHKEGGFIGIGGKDVSESEQAALDAIAATLEGGA
ncbi:MAG: hypothetical protein QOI65_270 [Thermoleophilaceae bacterium]|jgi:hypothetical protein|nr:hypothetical protein [Thermoleophilaceae bacterium]